MGEPRQASTTQTGFTDSTRTPSPEESEFNRLQLERQKFLDPQLRQVQSQGLSLTQALLSGQLGQGGQFGGDFGFLEALPGGIGEERTSELVQESLRDIAPKFQLAGLLDSGVRASISGRVAGDIRRQVEEFNIGNRLNLLNLALGGSAQIQQPIAGFSSQLSQRLAGLRSTQQTFGQTQTPGFGGGGGGGGGLFSIF